MSQPRQPLPRATNREQLRADLGLAERTFRRWLKRAGITHGRHILTPKEVGQVCDCLVKSAD